MISVSSVKVISFLSLSLFPSSFLVHFFSLSSLSLLKPSPLEKQVVPVAPPSSCLPDPPRMQIPNPLPKAHMAPEWSRNCMAPCPVRAALCTHLTGGCKILPTKSGFEISPVHFPNPLMETVTERLERTGTVRFLLSPVLSCFPTWQGWLPSNSCLLSRLPVPTCSLDLSSHVTHDLLLEAFAASSKPAFEAPGISQDA